MQEQPKVVDQMVAEMAPQQLPEEMGIGQLPAGEMNFAGGGIIAFADGGDVERYQDQGLVQDPQLASLLAARERYLRAGSDTSGIDQAIAFIQAKSSQGAGQKPPASAELPMGSGFAEQMMQGIAAPAPIAPRATMPEAGYTRPGMRDDPRLNTPPTQPVVAAPKADTTRKAPGAGLAAAAAAAAPKEDPFSMASIKKAQTEAMGDSNYKIGALNNQLVEIRNKAETQMQQRLDDRNKEIAAEGDVYKDRSDRLVERAKGLASQKNENAGLAFLNAGLAIMSTPGGLATALGKGAQVGTAQYAAGVKDLRAAQERLDEANDRISELRMNRKDLNSREIRALEKDRDNAILDGQKMLFGFAKDVYGMDRKQAEATFTSYMSGQEKKADIQSRERVSKAQIAAANRTPAEIQMVERIMKEKNIPFSEALASLTATKREPVSQEKLRGDWLDMAKRMQIQADYPNIKTFEDYMTVFGGGTGSAGGAGGFKVVGVR
jgi:hypothetical protein